MQFCDECGSMMHTAGDTWVCRSCENEEPCPADDCDSDRASYEMMPKPGGSYEVRLFTCVECGGKWRES